MENFFKDINNEELIKIYNNYTELKKTGIGESVFREYAITFKEKYFPQNQSLGLAIDIIKEMFFEEIANRYFVNLTADNKKSESSSITEKYLFQFRDGYCILLEAESKIKAINILQNEFVSLFEDNDFKVSKIFLEIDSNGDQISYER